MSRILLDGNSLLNAAILGGTDPDDGVVITTDDGKKVKVNGAQFGVDKFFEKIDEICKEFNTAPRNMILVWDHPNAKVQRQAILPGYKEGRSKVKEVAEQINIARGICTEVMLELGAHTAVQVGWEADDVIAYLCKTLRGERNTVVTSDGDLTVLVDENTDVWRLGKLNENPYGPFPHKYITLYKALVGDPSDKIPGAKGFGDAAWCELVRIFGFDGLDLMEGLIRTDKLSDLAEDVGEFKALQKVIDAQELVVKSWQVACLRADRVNTMQKPLDLKAGMVTQWGSAEYQPMELRRFYGTQTLVTAANYDAVRERFAKAVGESPFVALDIETSSCDQSDEWLEMVKRTADADRIDVLGHELTGMSLTFGANTQHTIYMSVDHKDTDNITVDQCREMCELIPHERMHTVIQNRQFEFSVLYRTWGEKWKDNGWHGFVPNALDTKIGASYVDENIKKGLKQRSLHHLGYTQASYEDTTCRTGPVGTHKSGQIIKSFAQVLVPAVYEQVEEVDPETGEIVTKDGKKVLVKAVTEPWETRQYKMKQLTGQQVLGYGSDDTICTAALHTHYKLVMDIEGTWDTYLAVETMPEYLTSLAYVQGIRVSMPFLFEMEKKDNATYEEAWKTLRAYLMTKGWEGTHCPEFETSIDPSDAKLAVESLLEGDFATKKRKLNGIAADIREQFPDNALATTLAQAVEENNVASLNKLLRDNFTGEPKINFGSPKQMQHLFYNVFGISPRIVNKLTERQREDKVLVSAFKKRQQAKRGGVVEYTAEERDALVSKSSTDDTAVNTALALDDLSDVVRSVLEAYRDIKEIQTRRNMFYKPYQSLPHWRDGRIHPSLNQSEAVTRRYSSSAPNIQQLPGKGEGARFRELLLAHHKDAVVVSLDWSGQELRLGAELSGDAAMTSCYVGDNKKDMHSLTAVAAAPMIWGEEVSYDDFQMMRKDPATAVKAKDLRDKAKTVNFASQYGAAAPKIAETLMCEESVAQAFLDARAAAFPGIMAWDKRVQREAKECGYARTMMGARRHLREVFNSDNTYDVSRAERQVGNFWIQASGAEMAKLAMAKVWESGICDRFDAVFYAPIHDELVFSVHKDDAVEFIKEAHACMVAPYSTMKIPLESSIALGPNFACDFEVGLLPDPGLINAALVEVFKTTTKTTTKEIE